MTEVSPRIGLGYVMPSQAQKHVTVNESLRRLDAVVQCAVKSATTTGEPGTPAEGDAYILPAGRSGPAWDILAETHIAVFQDGAFTAIPPAAGFLAYAMDTGRFLLFDGTAWRTIPLSGDNVPSLGINTGADANNRLAVKANAELLSHDDVTPGSGDARKVINKAGTGNTASLLLQTGFSGRAEIGLVGEDNLTVKVSSDGGSFTEVMRADAATGNLGVGLSATPVCRLDVAGPVRVAGYTVAALPPAGAGAGQIIHVTDASGGAVLAFSDGTNWRRVTDRAVVS